MAQISRPDDLKKYYQDDAIAKQYVSERFLLPKNHYLHSRQICLTNAALKRANCRRILELAPGPGRVTRYIQGIESGIAIDASEEMVALARAAVDPTIWEIRVGDILKLDLGTAFEGIFSYRFIRHFASEQRQVIYEVIKQHLVPGGLLVFDAPNAAVEGPFRQNRAHLYPIYDELWTEQGIKDELVAAGFRDVRLDGILRHHGSQRAVSFLTKRHLVTAGSRLIAGLDKVPGGQPLEWVVQCQR